LPEKSARKLIAKIKARFDTSTVLFWRGLLLIYAAILSVPQMFEAFVKRVDAYPVAVL